MTIREFNLTAATEADFIKEAKQIAAEEFPEWAFGHPSDLASFSVMLYIKALTRALQHASHWARGFSLMTATERRDVISRARSIGYRPMLGSSSMADMYISPASLVDETAEKYEIVVKKLGETVSDDIYFTNPFAIQVAGNGTRAFPFVSGKPFTINKVGTGSSFQLITIEDRNVVEGSLEVYVDDVKWEILDTLVQAVSEGLQLTVGPWPSNDFTSVYIQFGNGLKGKIPYEGASIKIVGRDGGGTRENITAVDSFTIASSPFPITMAKTLTKAQGGKDRESVESIKLYAPYAYSARYTLGKTVEVTSFVEGLPFIKRATCEVYNKLALIYAIPAEGTEISTSTAEEVRQTVTARLPLGYWAQVESASFVTPTIEVEFTTRVGYLSATVEVAIEAALASLLDPERTDVDEYGRLKWYRDFGQNFALEEIRALLSARVDIEKDWTIVSPTADVGVVAGAITHYLGASITATSRNTILSGATT